MRAPLYLNARLLRDSRTLPGVIPTAAPILSPKEGESNASISGRTSMILIGMSHISKELKPERVITGSDPVSESLYFSKLNYLAERPFVKSLW